MGADTETLSYLAVIASNDGAPLRLGRWSRFSLSNRKLDQDALVCPVTLDNDK